MYAILGSYDAISDVEEELIHQHIRFGSHTVQVQKKMLKANGFPIKMHCGIVVDDAALPVIQKFENVKLVAL